MKSLDTTTVLIALIGSLPGIITALVAAYLQLHGQRQLVLGQQKIVDSVNGHTDKLLDTMTVAAEAKGKAEALTEAVHIVADVNKPKTTVITDRRNPGP